MEYPIEGLTVAILCARFWDVIGRGVELVHWLRATGVGVECGGGRGMVGCCYC